MRTLLQKAVVLFLVSVIATSALFSWRILVRHHVDIVLQVEHVARVLALPFNMYVLSLKPIQRELPVPVYGVPLEDVSDNWGSPRNGGRTHEGTDIFAGRGTPVFSATEGYVVNTDFGFRGGRNVMIAGPGGLYYYYAHFDRPAIGLEKGMYVTQDTVLGYVGDSGNARGTPPHLHFGVYARQWDAVNPFPLLVERAF